MMNKTYSLHLPTPFPLSIDLFFTFFLHRMRTREAPSCEYTRGGSRGKKRYQYKVKNDS